MALWFGNSSVSSQTSHPRHDRWCSHHGTPLSDYSAVEHCEYSAHNLSLDITETSFADTLVNLISSIEHDLTHSEATQANTCCDNNTFYPLLLPEIYLTWALWYILVKRWRKGLGLSGGTSLREGADSRLKTRKQQLQLDQPNTLRVLKTKVYP